VGVTATRFSSFFISFGTPMIMEKSYAMDREQAIGIRQQAIVGMRNAKRRLPID
jgi:hypothetical protein